MIRTDLTAAAVTRTAKTVTGHRFTTANLGAGTFRTKMIEGPDTIEVIIRTLNTARDVFRAQGYEASVGQERVRVGLGGYVLTVTDTPRREREMEQQEARRVAAFAAESITVENRVQAEAARLTAAREAQAADAPQTAAIKAEWDSMTAAQAAAPVPGEHQPGHAIPADVLNPWAAKERAAAEEAASPAAVAKASGMYAVGFSVTGGRQTLSAVYPDLASAERTAEQHRANGEQASTYRPCGHAYNRYSSAACARCEQVQRAAAVLTQGGHLTGSLRAAGVEQEARDLIAAAAPYAPMGDDAERAADAEGAAARAALEERVAARAATSPVWARIAAEEGITAAEPAESLDCGTCGRGADSEAHALDHPFTLTAPAEPFDRPVRDEDGRALNVRGEAVGEPAPGTLPCYHVTVTGGGLTGRVYGVAAHGPHDARQMVQARLSREGFTARPGKAENVGRWTAEYGTVLAY